MLDLLIETTKTIKNEDELIDPIDYNEYIKLNNIEENYQYNNNNIKKKMMKNINHEYLNNNRIKSLKLLQIKQSKEYEEYLDNIIKIIQKFTNFLNDLYQSTKTLRENSEADLKNQVNEWKNNVLGYIKNMNENSEKSKGNIYIYILFIIYYYIHFLFFYSYYFSYV